MISTDKFQKGFQAVGQFPPWTRLNSRFHSNPDFELFSVLYILSPFYTEQSEV